MKILAFSLILFTGGILAFFLWAPQMGATSRSNAWIQEMERRSSNFREGRFRNSLVTKIGGSGKDFLKDFVDYLTGGKNRYPSRPLETRKVKTDETGNGKEPKVFWLGHSTCLIEVEGRFILTDPMFSRRASPLPFLGPREFPYTHHIAIEDLPEIEAVLISHDHYDHLDYASILALKEKVRHFYVPLGVGEHLKAWGIPESKITELDWWQEAKNGPLSFTATPARHFSGRGIGDRNRTLWASWIIRSFENRIFFGGDSGYFDGFKEIGDTYGPFDITLLECGAYNKSWPDIHMTPEQTLQAHLDLRGKVLLPIHWGKFSLSLHTWTEPVERLLKEAARRGAFVTTPHIGEAVAISGELPKTAWWRPGESTRESENSLSKENENMHILHSAKEKRIRGSAVSLKQEMSLAENPTSTKTE